MNEKLLDEIGFTQREKVVYLALLELGTSSVGPIIKKSKIPSSKIYETLDKLTSKGLVSYFIKNNKRHYQAHNPRVLLDFLDEKKTKVENEILPQLEGMYKFTKQEKTTTIYEGSSGIKSVYEMALKKMNKDDILYVLSSPSASNELLGPYLDWFHKRRIRKGIIMKILYNKEAKKYAEDRKKMKLTHVRYLPEKQVVLSAINMFLDYSLIFDYSDTASVILIKSQSIAHNFITYFEMLWNVAKF